MVMRLAPALVVVLAGVLAGCGGSSSKSSSPPPPPPLAATTTPSTPPTPPSSPPAPGGLQAEAGSAATGDIPDNQVFLVFRNGAGRYSMKYPEGWAQQGSGSAVTFRDKNNIVRIVITKGPMSVAYVRRGLKALTSVTVTGQPQPLTIGGAPAVEAIYRTRGAPNAVS